MSKATIIPELGVSYSKISGAIMITYINGKDAKDKAWFKSIGESAYQKASSNLEANRIIRKEFVNKYFPDYAPKGGSKQSLKDFIAKL